MDHTAALSNMNLAIDADSLHWGPHLKPITRQSSFASAFGPKSNNYPTFTRHSAAQLARGMQHRRRRTGSICPPSGQVVRPLHKASRPVPSRSLGPLSCSLVVSPWLLAHPPFMLLVLPPPSGSPWCFVSPSPSPLFPPPCRGVVSYFGRSSTSRVRRRPLSSSLTSSCSVRVPPSSLTSPPVSFERAHVFVFVPGCGVVVWWWWWCAVWWCLCRTIRVAGKRICCLVHVVRMHGAGAE